MLCCPVCRKVVGQVTRVCTLVRVATTLVPHRTRTVNTSQANVTMTGLWPYTLGYNILCLPLQKVDMSPDLSTSPRICRWFDKNPYCDHLCAAMFCMTRWYICINGNANASFKVKVSAGSMHRGRNQYTHKKQGVKFDFRESTLSLHYVLATVVKTAWKSREFHAAKLDTWTKGSGKGGGMNMEKVRDNPAAGVHFLPATQERLALGSKKR